MFRDNGGADDKKHEQKKEQSFAEDESRPGFHDN